MKNLRRVCVPRRRAQARGREADAGSNEERRRPIAQGIVDIFNLVGDCGGDLCRCPGARAWKRRNETSAR